MTDIQNTKTITNPSNLLFEGIHNYDFHKVKESIKRGANVNQPDPCEMYGWGSTPLHFACGRGYQKEITIQIIEVLLQAGANPNARRNNFTGETPLHYSVAMSNPDETKLLVKYGADINAVSSQGKTPMSIALDNLQLTQAKTLQNMGISINTVIGSHTTALTKAIRAQRIDVVRGLLKMGANPNFIPPGGESPLIACITHNQVQIIRILLNVGADINWVDADGDSFLHYVARQNYNRGNLIKLGIEAGANPNQPNKKGMTPLMTAILHYNCDVIDNILFYTNILLTDNKGNNIWHTVISTQDINLIDSIYTESMGFVSSNPKTEENEISLEAWREFLNQKNKMGKTPLQIAQDFENTEIGDHVEECLRFARETDITQKQIKKMDS